jgi:DeoR family transcriptional regulator of aga operon
MNEHRASAPSRLLVEERRRLIVEYVDANGRATVEELATRFGTSTVTIRNDLESLARAGAIARSHGGALPAPPRKRVRIRRSNASARRPRG